MAVEPNRSFQLGEIAAIQTGPFGSQLHASDYKEHGTPIITVEHLGDNEILHQNLPLVGESDRQRLAKYSLQVGDIVFTRVGAIDRRAYVSSNEDGWLFSGRLLRVRPMPNVTDGRFLSHQLGHHKTVQWIRNHAVGSTMACLNTSILSDVPLSLPPLLEQRRIAEILDTLDEVIRKTEQFIAKLKQVKPGLIYDLLTRGIDDNGELRDPEQHSELFKDSLLGRVPRKWAVGQLEEWLLESPRNGYSPTATAEWTGTFMLGLGCLTANGFEPVQLKHAPKNDPSLQRVLLVDGDLLISRANTRAFVGMVGSYRDIGAPCTYPDLMMRLRPTGALRPRFLEHMLRSSALRRQIKNGAVGTSESMVKISAKIVKSLVVAVPTLEEQGQILSRIESLESCLQRLITERSKLCLLKLGLMDDLLTGRVPVTTQLRKVVK